MDTLRPVKSEISYSWSKVRRHGWWVLLLVLAGTGGGAVLAAYAPAPYAATTSVLVQPVRIGPDTSTADRRTVADLDTEAQVLRSTAVATAAAKLLGVSTAQAERLASDVTVAVPAGSSVLVITYTADTPRRAQAGSHAFAQAYLQNRHEVAVADRDA